MWWTRDWVPKWKRFSFSAFFLDLLQHIYFLNYKSRNIISLLHQCQLATLISSRNDELWIIWWWPDLHFYYEHCQVMLVSLTMKWHIENGWVEDRLHGGVHHHSTVRPANSSPYSVNFMHFLALLSFYHTLLISFMSYHYNRSCNNPFFF